MHEANAEVLTLRARGADVVVLHLLYIERERAEIRKFARISRVAWMQETSSDIHQPNHNRCAKVCEREEKARGPDARGGAVWAEMAISGEGRMSENKDEGLGGAWQTNQHDSAYIMKSETQGSCAGDDGRSERSQA